MYLITLPLRVRRSKNKWFSLNLNQYRNAHYQVLNKTKIEFTKNIKEQLEGLPTFEKCTFKYTLYPPNKRLCDVANICSVVDKYFSDAFVEAGKMEDDNYLFLPSVTYEIGEIDKDNPRVEVEITPL